LAALKITDDGENPRASSSVPSFHMIEKTRIKQLASDFEQRYGTKPATLLWAPGRINIIGEHVDYVSYLPTSSVAFGSRENGMLMLVRPSNNGLVRGASTNTPYEPFTFDLSETPVGGRTKDLQSSWREHIFSSPPREAHWSNYIRGAVAFARFKFGVDIDRGFDFLLDSNLMPGGGASSSSALLILAGAALRMSNGMTIDRRELAKDSSLAEWYLGTRGGALDHMIICLSLPDTAIHLTHADQSVSPVPLSARHYSWVTFFSHPANKGRELMFEYNERAVVSRVIIPAMLAGTDPETVSMQAIEALPAEIGIAEFEKAWPTAFDEAKRLFPDLFRGPRDVRLKIRPRAEHHQGEVIRARGASAFLTLANNNNEVMRRLGILMDESHASLRDLYDVSTDEVEELRDVIRASPAVCGARLMGGGFGGNILALTPTVTVAQLIDRVQRDYYSPRGRDARGERAVMVSTPGPGLSEISLQKT
jgi:galactokinase